VTVAVTIVIMIFANKLVYCHTWKNKKMVGSVRWLCIIGIYENKLFIIHYLGNNYIIVRG